MAKSVDEVLTGEAGSPDSERVATALLAWYDRERRDLPWRSAPGVAADPYRVWLSEIMLQQTTVKAVIPYYETFLRLWPSVDKLAGAAREEVMRAWAGLGYYSRARNLHDCARAIVAEHGGRFPETEAELKALPGIGPYTAAAIAAIAFGRQATPVDGNIERVTARLFQVETPLPEAKGELKRLAGRLTPKRRAGDFAQGLMDLGAGVCTPRRPSCMICPLSGECRAEAAGVAETLPYRSPKGERPVRRGIAFFALSAAGQVLLRRRPDEGLLAQMMEVPSTDWGEEWLSADEALRMAPVRGDWWSVPGVVVHTFTHFRLELVVYRAVVPAGAPLTLWARQERCKWVNRRDLGAEALPSVMRKVVAHALQGVE
ncbi:MAG: A/G-specific adenine glycosylase [Hyphomicrobiaceae bacterium]